MNMTKRTIGENDPSSANLAALRRFVNFVPAYDGYETLLRATLLADSASVKLRTLILKGRNSTVMISNKSTYIRTTGAANRFLNEYFGDIEQALDMDPIELFILIQNEMR
jgi:hypothetical protein